jgi:putative ABC transport system permease protein
MKKDYILFAFNNLRRRRLRSWLTMLGIFIGIAAVVALIGLGEGLRSAVIGQFGVLGSDVLSVQASGIDFAGPPGQAVTTPLTTDLSNKIRRVSGVEAVINRYIESGTIEFNERQSIGIVLSIPSGEDRKTMERMLNLKAEEGRLLKDGDSRKVLLGNDFEDDALFGRQLQTGSRVLINDEQFEVVGFLEKKGSFIFDTSIFMNEKPLFDVFGDDGSVNVIGVKVKDQQRINEVKTDIEQLLRKERNVKKGEEDFRVDTPAATLDSLDSTLFAVQMFVVIIAGISLLVGGVGIMNTMYTSVLERTREIGIMKSIGATNNTIFSLFSLESGLLGMVGGIIGVLLGLTMAFGMSALGRAVLGSDLIQAQVSPLLIVGSLLFSFILGMGAGIVPAVQASKLPPVDALRGGK